MFFLSSFGVPSRKQYVETISELSGIFYVRQVAYHTMSINAKFMLKKQFQNGVVAMCENQERATSIS